MIRFCDHRTARPNCKPYRSDTFRGAITYYFEDEGAPRPSPQAFLVEQEGNWTLPAHYHRQYQFQVVVRGSGRIGAHAVAPFSVHYASAESPYGPLVSGAEGLSYFTIRAITDRGAHFMPEGRARMREGLRKLQLTSRGPVLGDASDRKARRTSELEPLIEPQADGLAAWFLRLPPGASLPRPESASNGGNFFVVAGGAMRLGETELPTLGVAFASADEKNFAIRAGDEGLEAVALQFPAAALLN